MAQNYTWPSVSVQATNPSVGTNGVTSPSSSTLVAGQNPSGNTQPLQTDAGGVLLVQATAPANQDVTIISPLASGRVIVDGSQVTQPISASALPLPSGASTAALQTSGNASLTSIDGKTPALVSGRVPVDGSGVTQPVSGSVTVTQATGTNLHAVIDASALPTGAATEATLATRASETTLSAINTKVPANLTVTSTRLLVDGSGVTQPVSAASLPLPTGAATSANQSSILARLSGSLVPAAYDEIVLSYTGDNVTSAVYKLATVTVKTLTLSYTGDRLDSVVAS